MDELPPINTSHLGPPAVWYSKPRCFEWLGPQVDERMVFVECEWLTGCLRVIDDKDPDSYVWTCTVFKNNDTLWLKGVMTMPRELQFSIRDALRSYCLAEGIRKVCWERRVRGKIRIVEKPVDRTAPKGPG